LRNEYYYFVHTSTQNALNLVFTDGKCAEGLSYYCLYVQQYFFLDSEIYFLIQKYFLFGIYNHDFHDWEVYKDGNYLSTCLYFWIISYPFLVFCFKRCYN